MCCGNKFICFVPNRFRLIGFCRETDWICLWNIFYKNGCVFFSIWNKIQDGWTPSQAPASQQAFAFDSIDSSSSTNSSAPSTPAFPGLHSSKLQWFSICARLKPIMKYNLLKRAKASPHLFILTVSLGRTVFFFFFISYLLSSSSRISVLKWHVKRVFWFFWPNSSAFKVG